MSRKRGSSMNAADVAKVLLQSDSSSSSSESGSDEYDSFSDDQDDFVVGETYENDYTTGKSSSKKKKSVVESKESLEYLLSKKKKAPKKKKESVAVDQDKADDIMSSFMNEAVVSTKVKKEKSKKKTDKLAFAAQLALKSKKAKKEKEEKLEKEQPVLEQMSLDEMKPKHEKAKVQISHKPISASIAKKLDIEAPVEVPDIVLDATEVSEYTEGKGFDGKYPELNKRDGKNSLIMFLYHTYEDSEGKLYLFGKTVSSQTVCIRVINTYRVLYFLPKDQNNLEICKQAINKRVSDAILEEFNGWYAFGNDLPYSAKWIRAYIPGKIDIKKLISKFPETTEEYTRVFHLTSDLVESFMMGNKIYGPCWVEVENLIKSPAHLCNTCALFDIDFKKPSTEENMKPIKQLSVLSKTNVKNLRIRRNIKDKNPKNVDTPYFNVSSVAFRMKFDKLKNESQICMITVKHFKEVEINSFEDTQTSAITFVCASPNIKLDPTKLRAGKVKQCSSESEVIISFIDELKKNDIDVVLGYDLNTFASQVLFERMKKLKIGRGEVRQSDVGRINKLINPKDQMNFFCGRLPVDLRVCADEFLRSKSNDFTSVVLDELNRTRVDIDPRSMDNVLCDQDKISKVIKANLLDSSFIKDLAVSSQVIPLTLQIAQLSGTQWARVLIGKASPRSEALLSHNFTDRGYIIPNKSTVKVSGKRGEAKFKGGHVLDPMIGFHEHCIMLLDYNSLYPSIIRQYDLCFATCLTKEKHSSVLPKIMEFLLNERKKVKEDIKKNNAEINKLETEMNDEETKNNKEKMNELKAKSDACKHNGRVFDIKQKAVKILANAMYGYLGYKGSRFPAQSIAELITKRGREALDKVINIVNTYQYTYVDEEGKEVTLDGFKIIYGDTDSVMVDSNTTDVKLALKIAEAISSEVNKLFKAEANGRQLMELGVDGIFLKMLLVAKKKYAALLYRGENLEPKLELKGLDMVRRDWCDLMKYASYYTICQFMDSENDIDTAVDKILSELKRISEMLNDNGAHVDSNIKGAVYSSDIKEIMNGGGKLLLDCITPKMLAITKVLKQDISSYSNAESMPHVKAAMILARDKKFVEKGASIQYIIVNGEDDASSGSEDENIQAPSVKAEKNSAVLPASYVKEVNEANIPYYLESQLYSTIKRLCNPFNGCIDPSMIANSLGVSYVSPSVNAEIDSEQSVGNYPHKNEIVIKCPYCGNDITISKNPLSYTRCQSCNEDINFVALHNLILGEIRKYLSQNNGSHLESRGMFQKEIATCQLPLSTLNVSNSTSPLTLRTSPTDIFNDLRYFAYLFEPLDEKMKAEIVKINQGFNFIDFSKFSEDMLLQARKFLNMHAFSHINFFKMFSKIRNSGAHSVADDEAKIINEDENEDESSSEDDDDDSIASGDEEL